MTDDEIAEVADTLRSGWITTGPKTKEFERRIAAFCGTEKAVCLNSATAGLELVLRIFGIGSGDEVITSAYTYTASASVINHTGAKIVLIDTKKDSCEMDYDLLEKAITERTKAIIPVDVAGIMCDYDRITAIVESKKNLYNPTNEMQAGLGRVLILSDAAHSFGAQSAGKKSGQAADVSCFSFHAVKNLTTAEGGAVTWNSKIIDSEDFYNKLMLISLHGQSKDAFSKMKPGSWEYDIKTLGYKCNRTDIMAALGLIQLKRYEGMLRRRHEIIKMYNEAFRSLDAQVLCHEGKDFSSSGHLYFIRINGIGESQRNGIITKMAERGISCNVHYKPLPMHSAYKALGFDINDYPNSYDYYKNEITLPLHTLLKDEEVCYVIQNLLSIVKEGLYE
jgi:dTDP-4-amino-4,6-dideoxygalactose transaminase